MNHTENPYQTEIDNLKKQMLEDFAALQLVVIEATEASFINALRDEKKVIGARIDAIERSGAFPSDEDRIRYFAVSQLLAELSS